MLPVLHSLGTTSESHVIEQMERNSTLDTLNDSELFEMQPSLVSLVNFVRILVSHRGKIDLSLSQALVRTPCHHRNLSQVAHLSGVQATECRSQ